MFNGWVFGSANSVTRPDRDNQYNMRIVYWIYESWNRNQVEPTLSPNGLPVHTLLMNTEDKTTYSCRQTQSRMKLHGGGGSFSYFLGGISLNRKKKQQQQTSKQFCGISKKKKKHHFSLFWFLKIKLVLWLHVIKICYGTWFLSCLCASLYFFSGG